MALSRCMCSPLFRWSGFIAEQDDRGPLLHWNANLVGWTKLSFFYSLSIIKKTTVYSMLSHISISFSSLHLKCPRLAVFAPLLFLLINVFVFCRARHFSCIHCLPISFSSNFFCCTLFFGLPIVHNSFRRKYCDRFNLSQSHSREAIFIYRRH